jgi:hypothetical protein
MQPKKCIATRALCTLLLALGMASAMAGTAIGTVTQLNGPLLLKRADGVVKAIALHSFVEQGDVLVSEKNTYAQLTFADASEITLRPNTQLKIEVFTFNENRAENLESVFSLAKGAVQLRTGLTGAQRADGIKLVAPSLLNPLASATVSRAAGTTFVAEFSADADTRLALWDSKRLVAQFPGVQLAMADSASRSDAPLLAVPENWDAALQLAQAMPPAPSPGGLAPGLYVHVIDGIINLSNRGGTQSFTAGQFGYTPNFRSPPVILPVNPGLKFTPPPAFSSSSPPSGGSSGSKSNTVDCEVR